MFHSVRQVFGCLLRTSRHNTLHAHCHLFCLAQLFVCFLIFSRVLCCIRAWMTAANGWGLSCLTNVGVEAEEPKLQSQRSGGGFTTHVINVPPSAWPISCSFTGASRVRRALHFYVVSLLVFVFSRAHVGQPHPFPGPSFEHDQTADSLPNTLVQSVDPKVVVQKQKRMWNLSVE